LASLSFSNFFRSSGVGACAELAEVLLFPLLEKVENKVNDADILILIKLSCKKIQIFVYQTFIKSCPLFF